MGPQSVGLIKCARVPPNIARVPRGSHMNSTRVPYGAHLNSTWVPRGASIHEGAPILGAFRYSIEFMYGKQITKSIRAIIDERGVQSYYFHI